MVGSLSSQYEFTLTLRPWLASAEKRNLSFTRGEPNDRCLVQGLRKKVQGRSDEKEARTVSVIKQLLWGSTPTTRYPTLCCTHRGIAKSFLVIGKLVGGRVCVPKRESTKAGVKDALTILMDVFIWHQLLLVDICDIHPQT